MANQSTHDIKYLRSHRAGLDHSNHQELSITSAEFLEAGCSTCQQHCSTYREKLHAN